MDEKKSIIPFERNETPLSSETLSSETLSSETSSSEAKTFESKFLEEKEKNELVGTVWDGIFGVESVVRKSGVGIDVWLEGDEMLREYGEIIRRGEELKELKTIKEDAKRRFLVKIGEMKVWEDVEIDMGGWRVVKRTDEEYERDITENEDVKDENDESVLIKWDKFEKRYNIPKIAWMIRRDIDENKLAVHYAVMAGNVEWVKKNYPYFWDSRKIKTRVILGEDIEDMRNFAHDDNVAECVEYAIKKGCKWMIKQIRDNSYLDMKCVRFALRERKFLDEVLKYISFEDSDDVGAEMYYELGKNWDRLHAEMLIDKEQGTYKPELIMGYETILRRLIWINMGLSKNKNEEEREDGRKWILEMRDRYIDDSVKVIFKMT